MRPRPGRLHVPAADALHAADAGSRVLDIDGLRRYTDEPVTKFRFEKDDVSSTRTYLALRRRRDGAYGVGVLNGWTAAGTRPAFRSSQA